MKILAICGSAHKGNTYSVLSSIGESYPTVDYKILRLDKANLEQCRGCYVCVLRGAEYCPRKDDRDKIIEEMLDADGVVLASPVYVNHATALMKNFLERVGYEGHRPRFYDKYAMVIAVCGMFGARETNEYMTGILTSFGFDVVSSLELQVATKTEKEKKYNHERTVEAFDTFIASISKGERNTPTVGQIMRFYIFKTISEASKEHFVADYEFYKDKADFPLEVNPLRKGWARVKAMMMLRDFMMNR